MKRYIGIFSFFLLLSGCATFKELSPSPELTPAERGYIELKDGKDNFALDKDGKYFIKIPKPEHDQFYLVLRVTPKSSLEYYLTSSFDDGKGTIEKIQDEAAGSDSLAVYPITTSAAEYFWVIESVKNDVELTMKYRYAPQWRFTFENKYAEFKKTLADNVVDRTTYGLIDRHFDYSEFRFSDKLAELAKTTGNVKRVRDELVKLQSIFPPNIAASRDTAYENYVTLRKQTEDEFKFQEDYTKVLSVFQKERETKGDVGKFVAAAPMFAEFVSQRERFPAPILEKARDVFTERLATVPAYFDEQLRSKKDSRKVNFDPPIGNAKKLYAALGKSVPADLQEMMSFVDLYNGEASAMQSVNEKFKQIDNAFGAPPPWSSDALYADLLGKVADIRAKIPESKAVNVEKYGRYASAQLLDGEIRTATARASASENLFLLGQKFVQHVNANSWAIAEEALKDMHYNSTFDGIQAVADEKTKLEKSFEGELFNRVKLVSQQRVDAFVKANEAAIENVAALYRDSSFVPVYQITFSAAGESESQRKRSEVQNYIDKLKYYDFPSASIKAIYRDFSRNINDKGVERARAIVEHGRNYKGDDKQLRSIVNECDPNVAKWISKPKEYRKQYALPVTTNPRGTNEYLFRVQLQIPSEAQFPVFEINVKLPNEVATKAKTEQWYKSITINKKLIKNEGRFTITAPTADNNYESQISPVQMDKEGRNILEVRFNYPGFKVFEISTMAQVPIIRKN